jgi:hypothetical protein
VFSWQVTAEVKSRETEPIIQIVVSDSAGSMFVPNTMLRGNVCFASQV